MEHSGRKGKRLNKHTCQCCRKAKSCRNPRYLLRALAFGKRVNYAPYGSDWFICPYGDNGGEPQIDAPLDEQVPGLSRWKKTIIRKNAVNKLNEWASSSTTT